MKTPLYSGAENDYLGARFSLKPTYPATVLNWKCHDVAQEFESSLLSSFS